MKLFSLFLLLCFVCGALVAQEVVFPLGLGDRWLWSFHYNDQDSNIDFKIVRDTVMPNGNTYFQHFMDGWLRQQGDTIFIYEGALETELLRYNFSASPGDTVLTYVSSDTFDVVLNNYGMGDMFGQSRRIWTFYHGFRNTPDTETWDTIVDSIGIVTRTRFPGYYDLLGAYVNETTFGTLTNISRDIPAASGFSLCQNYPNPFNSSTTIVFSVSKRQHVELHVFDLLGRQLLTPFRGIVGPGEHALSFQFGHLPSGVYFYTFITQQGSLNRQMLLTK